MKKKYHCPRHAERTPSAVVYGDHFYSFCCGAHGPCSELGVAPEPEGERYVENLEETFEYIDSLPIGSYRGFDFRHNDRGFYITWSDRSYYKLRLFHTDSPGGKYRCPVGVPKPVFAPLQSPAKTDKIILIEGELNAITAATVSPYPVICPGSAVNFYAQTFKEYYPKLLRFKSIYIIVDKDKAGVRAAIESKAQLYALNYKDVVVDFYETDLNDVYVKEGKDAARIRLQKTLGM
jgi:hypothetical protein